MKSETMVIHAGYTPDPETGALTPPIHLATTYERAEDGTYPQGFIYTRDNNPNRQLLETRVAQLEHGTGAIAFASGSVAMMTVLQALSTGDHVLLPDNIYYGIRQMVLDVFVPSWGLQADFVDMTDLDVVQSALRENTRLVVIETPSNPLLKITDIRAITQLAHEAGAKVICDNTIATPIFQQPLDLGCDLVVHATTKYMNGHSDVLGGIIVGDAEDELFQRVMQIQRLCGAVPSAMDCWLLLRGIQTLPIRMRAINDNAMQVAQFLEAHPNVERVLFPGLKSHKGHVIAQEQMSGYGGLMSILVKGDQKTAMTVASKVQVFTRATSFGGVHSQIEHRASVESPDTKTPQNLLRLAIGLEHVDDLIADLDGALG